jgi:hypothetical protein
MPSMLSVDDAQANRSLVEELEAIGRDEGSKL